MPLLCYLLGENGCLTGGAEQAGMQPQTNGLSSGPEMNLERAGERAVCWRWLHSVFWILKSSGVSLPEGPCFRVKVPAPPLPCGWKGLGVGERSNIHAGGSFAWGVTTADSLYPKLKLEVPLDGLGFFSKVWRGAGRCLGVSCSAWGQWMGREGKRDGWVWGTLSLGLGWSW